MHHFACSSSSSTLTEDDGSPRPLIFKDVIYSEHILKGFEDLRNRGEYLDVTLIAGDQQFPAHKLVLSAISPYFQAMFKAGMKEEAEGKIEMHDVDAKILQAVLHYIYTAKIRITEDNVYQFLDISDRLQILPLLLKCTHYIETTITTSNCLSLYVMAERRRLNSLANAAYECATHNFSKVMEDDEFLHLPVEAYYSLLGHPVLSVRNEDEVLEGFLRWLKHDPRRTEHVNQLASKICLHQVSLKLLRALRKESLLANTMLIPLVNRAICDIEQQRDEPCSKICLQDSNSELHCLMPVKKRYSSEQAVLFVVGGESVGNVWYNVECFTNGYDKWKCVVPKTAPTTGAEHETMVIPPTKHAHSNFACAATEYEIYVIGGRDVNNVHLNSVECYNVKSNQWQFLAPLPLSVVGARATIVENQVMVTGGQVETEIEKRAWMYDRTKNSWKEVAPMKKRRAFHGLVTVGGCVFALGGMMVYKREPKHSGDHHRSRRPGVHSIGHFWSVMPDENSSTDIICEFEGPILSSMERYIPQLDQWHLLGALRVPRYNFGCVAHREFIYVLGGCGQSEVYKTTERYDTLHNVWENLSPMPSARCDFAVAIANRCIYCIGGYNGMHNSNTVDKFSTLTNRWHFMESMQFTRVFCGAAALHVPVIEKEPM